MKVPKLEEASSAWDFPRVESPDLRESFATDFWRMRPRHSWLWVWEPWRGLVAPRSLPNWQAGCKLYSTPFFLVYRPPAVHCCLLLLPFRVAESPQALVTFLKQPPTPSQDLCLFSIFLSVASFRTLFPSFLISGLSHCLFLKLPRTFNFLILQTVGYFSSTFLYLKKKKRRWGFSSAA